MSGHIPPLRKDEVDQSRPCGAVFIDQHVDILIQRACSVEPVLDKLLSLMVINDEEYQDIKTEKTPQKQMRALLMGPIRSRGDQGKQLLYTTLMAQQPLMITDIAGES